MLKAHTRRVLLETARRAIQTFLETGNHEEYASQDHELLTPRGCFVFLHEAGKFRGSVGTFDDSKPLIQNTARMAVAASCQDTRFKPLRKSELEKVLIKVAVLGPLERVESLDSIEIGRHGVMVQYKDRRGFYLAETAVEKNWSVPEFVTYCAREKAGLKPEECAKAEIYRFEVEEFEEEEKIP